MQLRATSPTPREALARLISSAGRRDHNAAAIGLPGRGPRRAGASWSMQLRATSPTPREGLARLISSAGRRDHNAVVIGLLGRGIGASRSPIMHEREGARLGLDYAYRLIDFDRLELE